MKLANVDGLTDTFLEGAYGYGNRPSVPKKPKDELEESTEEETEINEQEEEEEEMMQDEEPVEEPADDLAMADEDPASADDMEPGAADISLTEEEAKLLIDLGERLKEAMGEDGDMGMGAEPEGLDDMSGDEDVDPVSDLEDEEDDEMDDEMMQEEIVNEVLKRVTKRIVAERIRKDS
tara:strand:+ start:334 stop:867 length:534 start_codon:yes stop_codon:yes gene_type:complete